MSKVCPDILTSNQHDDDGKNLLHVGVGRDIPKSYAGEAGEGEVERGDILGLDGGPAVAVVVGLLGVAGQGVQPTDLVGEEGPLRIGNSIPDAGEPVGNEREGSHEEQEHCGPILRVAVDFAGYPHQAQQASGLQQTDQGRRLKGNMLHRY